MVKYRCMKIGISTSTFFNTVASEGVFDLLRNMRAETSEVCLNTFSEYEKTFVDKLAQYRGAVDVSAVSPLSTQFEPQLFSPNIRVRADAELLFKKVCYACFALGAKYYTFRGQANLSGKKDFDYTRTAQRYAQLADIAAGYGVSLSLKNMSWSHAATPAYFKQLFEVVPPQRVSLIEVADCLKDKWCLPGRGKYRFDKLFYDLERRKIIAPVLLAVRSDSYTDFIQVRDAFEYLVATYKGQ